MGRVDEPKFTVVKSEGKIQIRDYDPIVVAEVEVDGERIPAINAGFRKIFDYIFGNNVPAQKIAMTAPVTQQESGDVWKIRFVMPAGTTPDTLPEPNSPQIKLTSVEAKRFAVIRFSGFNTDRNMTVHRKVLLDYVVKNKLVTIGEPTMAFYNPPWTLPFLKRNEIMIELQK